MSKHMFEGLGEQLARDQQALAELRTESMARRLVVELPRLLDGTPLSARVRAIVEAALRADNRLKPRRARKQAEVDDQLAGMHYMLRELMHAQHPKGHHQTETPES